MKIPIENIVNNHRRYFILIDSKIKIPKEVKYKTRGKIISDTTSIVVTVKLFKPYKIQGELSWILESDADLSSLIGYPFEEHNVFLALEV